MSKDQTFNFRKSVFPLIFLLLFLMLSGLSGQAAAQEPHSFPFLMQRNKTILTARIGENSPPLRLLLDSGMGFDGLLIYNPDLKDSIQLKNAVEAAVPGAGKGKPSQALMADSMTFSIGGVAFRNQRIVMLQEDRYRGFPSDGVVGYSLFGHYAVEINHDDLTITLHPPDSPAPDSSWTALPIELRRHNIPWMQVRVAVAEDDTAAAMSMYIDYASGEALELLTGPGMKYRVPDSATEVFLGRGLSGDVYGKRGRAARLLIGPWELREVRAAFTPAEVRSRQQGADGILGNDIFRRFNVIFSYAQEKLWLKPNSHFGEPF